MKRNNHLTKKSLSDDHRTARKQIVQNVSGSKDSSFVQKICYLATIENKSVKRKLKEILDNYPEVESDTLEGKSIQDMASKRIKNFFTIINSNLPSAVSHSVKHDNFRDLVEKEACEYLRTSVIDADFSPEMYPIDSIQR